MKRDKGQLDVTTWEADIGILTRDDIHNPEPEPVAPDAWARGILQVKKGVVAPKVSKAKELAVPAKSKSVARDVSNASL